MPLLWFILTVIVRPLLVCLWRFVHFIKHDGHLLGKSCPLGFPLMLFYWATSWQNLLLPYANNKDADQPAHPRSLISVFVIRCLDSIVPLFAIFERSRLWLASVAAQAGLCLTWSQTPKIGFLVTWLILSRLMFVFICRLVSGAGCGILLYRFLIIVVIIWATSRENLSSGFATKVDSNRPAQLQRLARGLIFRL